MVKISVIICTYNRSESLKDTLRSVSSLIVPEDLEYEIIIVDNNSSDHTKVVVDEFKEHSNVDVRYLFEANQGLSFARNKGVLNASGEIIAFTDDDVLLDKYWLNNICEAFETYGCDSLQGKIKLKLLAPRPKWMSDKLHGLARADYGDVVKKTPTLIGANMATRAELFAKYGLFDTNLGAGRLGCKEDTEFYERIRDKGALQLYCPQVLVTHIIQPHRLTKRAFRKAHFNAGRCDAYMRDTDVPLSKYTLYTGKEVLKNALKASKDYFREALEEGFLVECTLCKQMGYLYQLYESKIA